MSCRTCHSLDCDDGPALGTYSLQRVILPEVASAGSGSIALAALGVSNGCLGTAFSANIISTGRSANSRTTLEITSGSLPTGLTLTPNGHYATISGTPTVGGVYRFTVLAMASDGAIAAKAYTIAIYRNWVPGACTLPATGTVQNIALDDNAYGIAYCPTNECIYTVSANDDRVFVVNVRTGELASTVSLPAGSFSYWVCYAPTNDRIYVVNSGTATVSIIDPSTNLVVSTISVDPQPWVCCFGNGKVFVSHNANVGDDALTILSTASTPGVIGAIVSGVGPGELSQTVEQMIYSEQNNQIYAFAVSDLITIDASTDAILATYAMGQPAGRWSQQPCLRLNSTPDRYVFVPFAPLFETYPSLVALAYDNSVSSALVGAVADHHYRGAAWREDTDRIYVSGFDNSGVESYVLVVNPTTMTVESTIPLADASYPYSVIWIESINQIVVGTEFGLSFIT